MAIIRQKNRRNGIEYVFLSVSKRVPEKKWPVSERTSLGHFDLAGDFVPSRHFLALDEQQQLATGLIDEPYIRKSKETSLLVRKRCGFDLLFSHAARRTHVDRILRSVFPSDWTAPRSRPWESCCTGRAGDTAKRVCGTRNNWSC